MPRFLPFNGLVCHPAKGEDAAELVTPQFDELQMIRRQELAARSRHNFVRFESARDLPGEHPGEDRHQRAAGSLEEARQTGRIRKQEPAYYLMEISSGGASVRGFAGMFELTEHARPSSFESVAPDAVADRARQLGSLGIQTAPISLGYRTTASGAHHLESIAQRVMRAKPLIAFADGETRHKLWRIDRDAFQLEPLLSKKSTVLLDGAARFTAALDHAERARQADPTPSPFRAYNFALAWMIDIDRNPVEFNPRHRAIVAGAIPHMDGATLLTRLEDFFEIERYKLTSPGAKEAELVNLLDEMDCIGKLNHSYGFYIGDKAYYLMYLRDADSYERMTQVRHSRRWKRLDISVLHSIVFDGILETETTPDKISAPLSAHQAVSLVDDGFADAAFLLNRPVTDHLVDIAEASEPIPPASVLLARRPLVGPLMADIGNGEYVGEDA